MPTPDQPVHWIDAYGRQVGPEPLDTVVQRVHAGQIPTPPWSGGKVPPTGGWHFTRFPMSPFLLRARPPARGVSNRHRGPRDRGRDDPGRGP